MPDLKPCPFCGHAAHIGSNRVEIFVECEGCGVRTFVSVLAFVNAEEVKAATDRAHFAAEVEWNTRREPVREE